MRQPEKEPRRAPLCDDLVGTWPDAVQPPCQDITGPFRRDDARYNQSVRAIEHTPVTSAGSLRVAIQSELEIDPVALEHWLVDAWAPMKLTVEVVPLQTLWTTSPAHRTGQWDVVIANLTPTDLTAHFGLDGPANWFNQTPPLDGLLHSSDPSTGRALHAAMEADPRWLFLVQIDAMAAWLIRLIDASGAETASLAGHSMGAFVSLAAAAVGQNRITNIALIGIGTEMYLHVRQFGKRLTEKVERKIQRHSPPFRLSQVSCVNLKRSADLI